MSGEWCSTALGRIARIAKGSSPTERTQPGPHKFVVTADDTSRTADTYQFTGPAVCIPTISSTGHGHASIKRLHVVGEERFALANIMAAAVIRDPSSVDETYLWHFLTAHKDTLLVPLMQGTANVALRIADLESVTIRLPDIAMQRRIVDLMSAADRGVAAHEALVDARRVARQALLVSLLDSVTERRSLADVASITMGQAPPGDSYNQTRRGTPFMQGCAEFGDRFAHPVKWTTAPSRLAEIGDVLLSVRAPVGAVNLASTRTAIGRGLAAIRGGQHASTEYLRLGLQYISPVLAGRATGTTFPAITGKELRAAAVPLPAAAAQRHIVSLLDGADDSVASALQSLRAARRLREELLHDLLSGTHRIPDSYDDFGSARA